MPGRRSRGSPVWIYFQKMDRSEDIIISLSHSCLGLFCIHNNVHWEKRVRRPKVPLYTRLSCTHTRLSWLLYFTRMNSHSLLLYGNFFTFMPKKSFSFFDKIRDQNIHQTRMISDFCSNIFFVMNYKSSQRYQSIYLVDAQRQKNIFLLWD